MKILLPFDGSGAALQAVKSVIGLAGQGLATEVVLVNVQEPASLYELVIAHDPQVIEQVSQAAGTHILQSAQAMLRQAGIKHESVLASGDPAHAVADLLDSHGCQMVVLGASGTSALRSALLGSVCNEVLHRSAVPVMIVKALEPEPDDTP